MSDNYVRNIFTAVAATLGGMGALTTLLLPAKLLGYDDPVGTTNLSGYMAATGGAAFIGLACVAWRVRKQPQLANMVAGPISVAMFGLAAVRLNCYAFNVDFSIPSSSLDVRTGFMAETIVFSALGAVVATAVPGLPPVSSMPGGCARVLANLPTPLKAWLVVLCAGSFGSSMFALSEDWARVWLLAQALNTGLAVPLYLNFGFSRILGLCHVVAWLPPLILMGQAASTDVPSKVAGTVVGISYVIDVIDTVRFLAGDTATFKPRD